MADGAFHLFAYGSLKSASTAEPGHELLAGCERVGDGTVRGTLYEVGEYPALLLSGDDSVSGVIWRCPFEALARLDAYEGIDRGLFRRAAVEVDGTPCWVYVAGPRLGPRLIPESRITTGDWSP